MNPKLHPQNSREQSSAGGFGLDDVYFTVFRHKRLLLICFCLGAIAAVVVRFVTPVLYSSNAKLLVRYVLENRQVNPSSQDSRIVSPDSGGENILNSEAEILTSLDVAKEAASVIGPTNILAIRGGGTNLLTAAGAIRGGLYVSLPRRSDVIVVGFEYPDKEVVQPVLNEVIKIYKRKHEEIHLGLGLGDDYYAQERDKIRDQLSATEKQIEELLHQAKVVSIEDTRKTYAAQISKLMDELLTAQTELAEHKALLGDLSSNGNPTNDFKLVPQEKLDLYAGITKRLSDLTKREQDLLLQYTDAHPEVQAVRRQIAELKEKKADLERAYPLIAELGSTISREGNNVSGVDLMAEMAGIKALSIKVNVLQERLSNVQVSASSILALEPKVSQLQRQKEVQEQHFRYYSSSLEQAREGELNAGKVTNISVVEKPTPPIRDNKRMLKMIVAAFGGAVGLGLGLAFLIDFVLDRTIKRPSDVKRCLRLPFLIAIPDTNWNGRLKLPSWLTAARNSANHSKQNNRRDLTLRTRNGLAPWDREHPLRPYADALRDRLVTYFEVNDVGHKPKRVAITSCGVGSGVTTLAGGLAAALSKTGDGNVLLVDMNSGQGEMHPFYNGEPSDSSVSAPPHGNEAEAQTQKTEQTDVPIAPDAEDNANNKLVKALPTAFAHLVPLLKTDDYDYIVFDMPPVSQTSVTPRLAGHMEVVLMVLESEKTGQILASHATALMGESLANILTVLNKYRQHVPAQLSQEL